MYQKAMPTGSAGNAVFSYAMENNLKLESALTTDDLIVEDNPPEVLTPPSDDPLSYPNQQE